MRIIPAIDIIEGKCVRLTKGDYTTQKIYNEDPLEVAKAFESSGVTSLHLVDLDGAKAKSIVNHRVLEKLATHTGLKIDFGGGLKSDTDLKIAFDCGAYQITGGSVAVKNPEIFNQWLVEYGSDKIILGADVKGDRIAVSGWMETSEESIFPFVKKYQKEGVQYVICTDISKDGMLEGPAFTLYQSLLTACPEIKLIASGGVSDIEELPRLANLGCEGVIIGKAIYEKKISLKRLESYIIENS
ncbi:MAG: 1-(5-phosphoribosyl)-5-[(5-phosphoribosylamino)methylideneamino]imidazole-4-carboxamide isomerase [Bacteroidetes bacterium]|jgi:phosphoribosylformimino-5-aminoimidazole carboxamide ribotide isomerase|nr:1-(5-phosphoribosyl)-5-[(5-phosphoribosylamino)methylideneamino]imidazole-4-carboxamide isomerase [Flavobacteriaceae bacterium]MDG1028690.1 1-(5-phosphoribosyl)-5-[(5-phosphoribosylamino)methylideneamino]imidazole-4-carboxamide isomerase [Flavobacteriaceae bacterium]MDG1941345.1 1-(5-phosphoribosyl)-5-[(5-phosphoribosylamino)methylideneamino]imidazole-4-carboxamide isomerase [Flavobacteriaceae bacterium]NCF31864.1 1-(5-phosphoribosyl)-5-[(5-phosphoribosylamino)methylideneamino]imidazole-4-car